jgi:hypothetical protein
MTTRKPLVLVAGELKELPASDALPSVAAVTSAGTTAADATVLTADLNSVTSTTTAQGVRLPAALDGKRIIVSNTAGNRAINVYPASGDAIDLYGVDAVVALAAYSYIEVVCVTAGQWLSSIRAAQSTTYFTSTLAVNKGGTGATTLTGLVKGNGTGAFTAAAAGTDYQAAGTYATGTGTANGTNTGDETATSIKAALGITTLSGSNTGDQTLPTTLPASDVYTWAKASVKPTYTASEVSAQDVLVSGTNIRTVNGSSLLGSGDLVISGGASSFYTRTLFTATAAQTTFSAAYTAGYVDVYLNGAKLIVGSDFTATNGTTVVLASGAAVGDAVEVLAFTAFNVADTYTQTVTDGLLAAKQDTITHGTTTVTFGAGATDASVSVSSTNIGAGSLPQAWVLPTTTASNTADDHQAEDLTVFAGGITAGVGFTIFVRCNTLKAHGIFNIAWSYL